MPRLLQVRHAGRHRVSPGDVSDQTQIELQW